MSNNECLSVACPGPDQPVTICVLEGLGSQLVKIKYFKGTQIDFAAVVAPGPWTGTVTVYKADDTVLFTLASPARVTLGSTGYNVQFQFLDADFTGLPTPAPLGEYHYRVVLTPTVGSAILVAYGRLSYTQEPTCC